MGDGREVVQMGPAGGESHDDAAGADDHFGGDLDQPGYPLGPPGFDVTLAERVAAAVKVARVPSTFQGIPFRVLNLALGNE